MVQEHSGAWELPEELVMLRDTVRRFMDAHVHPLEEKLAHDTVGLPREQLIELQAQARALGLWALQTPAEYGGAGLSVLGQVVVAEYTDKELKEGCLVTRQQHVESAVVAPLKAGEEQSIRGFCHASYPDLGITMRKPTRLFEPREAFRSTIRRGFGCCGCSQILLW